MDEAEMPALISCKLLKSEFSHLNKIFFTSKQFTVGRNVENSVIIPFISISRLHCRFHKSENHEWFIKDNSSFGITINNKKIDKGLEVTISDGDIITFDPTAEFVYKFSNPKESEIPTKRIKLRKSADNSILDDVKLKFEESLQFEIKHIEKMIQNAKHAQNKCMLLINQLQADMDRKTKQFKSDFAQKMKNLKGKKNEVKKRKALLLEKRDQQLAHVRNEMEGRISELMEQIQKHQEAESELLKEKLAKEREEFLPELSRENYSRQDLLERLEAKIQEQEETRKREKQELQEALRKETEELRLAQEKELKEVEEQKRLRELELKKKLNNIRQMLQQKVEETEQRKRETEQLNQKMEQLQKLREEEKIKVEQLEIEREQVQDQLLQAQNKTKAVLTELRRRAKAQARIQREANQSSEEITSLQDQLEKTRSALNEVGEIVENELQCSICTELFVKALTLNCSHTFCKYCITMWMKKNPNCAICRAPITAGHRSIVIDSVIEKMVQNLAEELQVKRQDLLKLRADLVAEMARQTAGPSRSRSSVDESEISDEDEED